MFVSLSVHPWAWDQCFDGTCAVLLTMSSTCGMPQMWAIRLKQRVRHIYFTCLHTHICMCPAVGLHYCVLDWLLAATKEVGLGPCKAVTYSSHIACSKSRHTGSRLHSSVVQTVPVGPRMPWANYKPMKLAPLAAGLIEFCENNINQRARGPCRPYEAITSYWTNHY